MSLTNWASEMVYNSLFKLYLALLFCAFYMSTFVTCDNDERDANYYGKNQKFLFIFFVFIISAFLPNRCGNWKTTSQKSATRCFTQILPIIEWQSCSRKVYCKAQQKCWPKSYQFIASGSITKFKLISKQHYFEIQID